MRLLSVDPGKHQLGIAYWIDDQLFTAELVDTFGYRLPRRIDVLVVELPQIYPSRRQKGRQRDLIELAVVVGRLEEKMFVQTGQKALRYEPHAWKGQLDKKTVRDRARELLSKDELECVIEPKPRSKAHNIWDSIGLGLVHLKRCRRGLV